MTSLIVAPKAAPIANHTGTETDEYERHDVLGIAKAIAQKLQNLKCR